MEPNRFALEPSKRFSGHFGSWFQWINLIPFRLIISLINWLMVDSFYNSDEFVSVKPPVWLNRVEDGPNCSGTALELLWNCSVTALTLLWHCSDIGLKGELWRGRIGHLFDVSLTSLKMKMLFAVQHNPHLRSRWLPWLPLEEMATSLFDSFHNQPIHLVRIFDKSIVWKFVNYVSVWSKLKFIS